MGPWPLAVKPWLHFQTTWTTAGMLCQGSGWSLAPGSAASATVPDSMVRSCWLLRLHRRSYESWSLPYKQVWVGKSTCEQQIFSPHKYHKDHWLLLAFCVGFQQKTLKTHGSMCSAFSKTMLAAVLYPLEQCSFLSYSHRRTVYAGILLSLAVYKQM